LDCKTLNNAVETLTQEIISFSNKIYALQQLKIDNVLVQKTYSPYYKKPTFGVKEIRTSLGYAIAGFATSTGTTGKRCKRNRQTGHGHLNNFYAKV
jgi:hypothetical protein